MSLYGGALKKGYNSQLWQVPVPSGLAGHLQLIAFGFGIGASRNISGSLPGGFQQYHNYGHSQEDVTARWYYRVLTEDTPEQLLDFNWSGQVPGVSIAVTRANETLTLPGEESEGPFSTTFTPDATPVSEPHTALTLVARKDPRVLVSWPGMTVLDDHFFPGANTVSASVGSRAINSTDNGGKEITIRDAYNGGFDTAPFVSSTLLLRSTGSAPIPISGEAIFANAGDQSVDELQVSAPASFAKGATRDITVTVIGEDGNPLEGATVAIGTIAIATADAASKESNASGQVTFTMTGVSAGTRQLQFTSQGVSASVSVTVTGAATSVTTEEAVVTAGNQLDVTVTAVDANGDAVADSPVDLAISGVSVIIATPDPRTDNAGVATVRLQADAAGTFTVRAVVGAIESLPLSITVNPVVFAEGESIRLRGETYERPSTYKR